MFSFRINLTLYKLDQFLLGDALEEMISALSASEQAEKLNHLNDSWKYKRNFRKYKLDHFLCFRFYEILISVKKNFQCIGGFPRADSTGNHCYKP